MNKLFSVILLFLLLCSEVQAQKTSPVLASADKSKILLGEQFDLVLGARFTDGAAVNFFSIDSLPHFEIVQRSKIDTERADQDIILTQRITLTSFDSGRWQIPAISLVGSQLKTKPIAIDVVFSSPFDPKKDYHDVKDILSIKKPANPTWYWYVIGAVLLLLLFMLLFPRKKKPKTDEVLDANAYRTAISDLQKLQREGLSQKDIKAFYVRLVDIFRKYLHTGKGLHSFSKTTDDLALQILKLNLTSDRYNELVQVLKLGDAVKYAKFIPDDAENNHSMEVVRKSIEAIEKR
jgi:hypothetical protein